jgi:hypothetical protein
MARDRLESVDVALSGHRSPSNPRDLLDLLATLVQKSLALAEHGANRPAPVCWRPSGSTPAGSSATPARLRRSAPARCSPRRHRRRRPRSRPRPRLRRSSCWPAGSGHGRGGAAAPAHRGRSPTPERAMPAAGRPRPARATGGAGRRNAPPADARSTGGVPIGVALGATTSRERVHRWRRSPARAAVSGLRPAGRRKHVKPRGPCVRVREREPGRAAAARHGAAHPA